MNPVVLICVELEIQVHPNTALHVLLLDEEETSMLQSQFSAARIVSRILVPAQRRELDMSIGSGTGVVLPNLHKLLDGHPVVPVLREDGLRRNS
jgi:hypothetical protein